MAGIDPQRDPRGARWEQRLRVPVLGAALLAIPTVLLYFSDLGSTAGTVAVALSWLIWSVFLFEAVIMLSVVAQRRAWMRGHLFGLAILLATFPLLTKFLEALLAARALSSLQGVRLLQVLYLAKTAKLLKSWIILRRTGRTPRHPVLLSVAALLAATAVVGILDGIVSGEKNPTPFHGAWDLVEALPVWSLAVALGVGAALVIAVLTLRSPSGTRPRPRAPR